MTMTDARAEAPRRLTLFHTADSNIDVFDRLLGELSAGSVMARHVVRAELLSQALDAGAMTERIRRETTALLQQLAAADTDLVLCTCSTLGPAADDAAAGAAVPILRVDRPMMEDAVRRGGRRGAR